MDNQGDGGKGAIPTHGGYLVSATHAESERHCTVVEHRPYPVACWRLQHAFFAFDSSMILPSAAPELARLEAKVKAYLTAGDRESAARFALELQKAKQEMVENEAQLQMHEKAYDNNVVKIKHASKKLSSKTVRFNISGISPAL